ncbi:MAG: DUF2703 domain-containing protein [Desulfuromonadales bacterium]|nr:DUF2703 domain-containing protein [Desulfuromonadales bacterium]
MKKTKTLTIKWQRLLDDGQTCPRCGSTEEAVDKAAKVLRQSLTPLGVDVILEKAELSVEQFAQDTLQSNTIWINGQLLEKWLGAQTGQSQCCEVCGPNDCRTMDVGGDVFEVIPVGLIVKAGLLAATQLLDKETCNCDPAESQTKNGCCPE